MQDPLQPNPLGIKISTEWVSHPTDFSICAECESMIVSENMWQLVVFVNYEPIERTEKYCENCYESGRQT